MFVDVVMIGFGVIGVVVYYVVEYDVLLCVVYVIVLVY